MKNKQFHKDIMNIVPKDELTLSAKKALKEARDEDEANYTSLDDL